MKLWQKVIIKTLQRHWRYSRGLTLGVQAVVMNEHGDVLLLAHGDEGYALPLGNVEPGESTEIALERVLAEEAGLALTARAELLDIVTDPRRRPDHHLTTFLVRSWHVLDGCPSPVFFSPLDLPDKTEQDVAERLRTAEKPRP